MAGHGSRPLRGLESTSQSSVQTAKFGRMFRWLTPAISAKTPQEDAEAEEVLATLAALMVTSEFDENVAKGEPPDTPLTEREPEDENPSIPAGYTYLGQFIDHDITFDPASSLQQMNDPSALEDFRTPRLDLDSVYGRGNADQPYLYAKPGRTTFILGDNRGVGGMDRPDLPRTPDGTAIIGDKRNDENKIVSQLQALFMKFHNKVFAALGPRFPAPAQADDRFLEAQRIVRWCYQYIVLRDFLPKVCDPAVVQKVMSSGDRRGPDLQFYRPHDGQAYIPVEFSVAAYRFGHSMVRPSYALNTAAKSSAVFTSGVKIVPFSRIPIFVARAEKATDAMNGFGALPGFWGIDWSFFFGPLGTHKAGQPQIPQPSYRIDASLVDPLGALPDFVEQGAKSPFVSLAFRNLRRGMSMGLPSGQRVARMMNVRHPLTEEQLWTKKNEGEELEPWPEGEAFYAANRKWLEGNAPLWYYVLKEAEVQHHGRHLGDVGSRIVAETLVGLAWHDHYSYLFQMPAWTPADEKLTGLGKHLDMLELTQFVDL